MALPFFQDSEQKMMLDQERRSMNFQRENLGIQVGSSSPDDGALMQELTQQNDLVRWQQDLNDELAQLLHDLRRERQTTNEGWKRPDKLQPLLNDSGVAMVEEQLRPLLSRNMINTNLNEDQIMNMLRFTCRSIRQNLMNNYDEYQMNPLQYRNIMRLIKNAIIPTPNRALNNGERVYTRTFNKRVETITPSAIEQPKGVLQRLGVG